VKFRSVIGLCCGAAVAAGLAADVLLLDRPAPVAERPLKDHPRFTERHLAAVLARRAPRMAPALRDRLSEAVMNESARAGYDPIFVLSLIAVESGFKVRAESERGARGLVQLKPSTFAWISAREPDVGGAELMTGEDPVVDLKLAVRYLSWLEKKFQSRDAALFAYNAGPRRAARHIKAGLVPDKLKDYARLVRREHERLAAIADQIEPLPDLPIAAAAEDLVLVADGQPNR
jgi:soluble lytic murein transglycosylase-like protein